MKELITKENLEDAEKLLEYPDEIILALGLSKNEKWAENYLMTINLKLQKEIIKLRDSIELNSKINKRMTWIMIILTVFLVVLTVLLVFR